MPVSGLVFFNDRDLYTDFSFVMSELSGFPGQISGVSRELALTDGPEMQGAMLDPRLLRRKPGTATVSGYISMASPALALAALDALKGLVGLGEFAVRTIYAPDRYCLAVCESVTGSMDQPKIVNGEIAVRLSLTIRDAIAWRTQPDGIALSTTRTACPIGTAESRPVILVHNAGSATSVTNPVISVRNASGDIVQTMSFTMSISSVTALRVDTARSSASYINSGSISDALAAGYWAAGDFPVLRPYDGFVESGAYPSVELSSDTGTPFGLITYTRGYL